MLSSGVLLRQISQQKRLFKQGDHTYPPKSQRQGSFFSWTTSKIFKVSFGVTVWHKWFKEFAHLSAEKKSRNKNGPHYQMKVENSAAMKETTKLEGEDAIEAMEEVLSIIF